MAKGQYQQWFLTEIATGLQKLVVLSLQGTPAMEIIELTGVSWAETLWAANIDWHQELDSQRISAAFVRIMRDVDRWPAPKALLAYLPTRPQPKCALLGAPRISEEQRQINLSKIRELTKLFRGGRG